MRKLSGALGVTAALILMAGCNGGTSSSSSSLPTGGLSPSAHGIAINAIAPRFMPKVHVPMRGKRATPANEKGIYVSTFFGTAVYGFPKNNSGNAPSTCSVPVGGDVNDFATDNSGNLVVPDGLNRAIDVFQGPQMCGTELGTVADSYGQPASASAVNAATGTIVVGNIFDNSGAPGSVSVCTLSGGCTANLTNSAMYEVAGVALAPNGDCWASAISSASVSSLIYFQGCTGSGVVATGYTNPYYGGVDIDNKGNLVTMSLFGASFSLPSLVNVYSGCNPACTLLSSTKLQGESIFGHVGKQNERFVTTDISSSDVEVYKYASSGLSLLYSFTGGLPCATDECESAAYSPSSQK